MGQSESSTQPFLIAPSLLSADFANLGAELKAIEAAGADWIHVDVMDGLFVPNLTIGPPVIRSLRSHTKLPLDVHLMIEKPEKSIEAYAKAGANHITIHIESTDDVEGTLKRIRALGCRPGLTLRPGTAVELLKPYLALVDLVLVMTVEPGFGGQSFMHDQVTKVAWLRRELRSMKSKVWIEVDGGVNDKTATELVEADVLVAGQYVFGNKQNPGDYGSPIRKLKSIARSS